MATTIRYDETLVERDEVSYPNANMIDSEPFYKNFTMIQNFLQHNDEHQQIHTPIYGTNDIYRANRVEIEPYSSSPNHSNELTNLNHQNSSKIIDGYIFNLIKIVENIGYNPKSPFINSSQNTAELFNIILDLGGAYGPLANIWRSHINKEYFQKWYLEKYYQCNKMINIIPQKSDDYQENSIRDSFISNNSISKQTDDDNYYQNEIQQIYGYDDIDTTDSISSRCSSIENFKPKQQITIREYYTNSEKSSSKVNCSLSPSLASEQINIDNKYEQFIHNHSEINNDLIPDIITKKANPEYITYKQNISIRYLIPPTPPPSGPLIIREILPPHPSTPPPLIIKDEKSIPVTPPPLILREAPPSPPPYQEPKVITKILPQEPSLPPDVITEQHSPLPPKPQSIIIEKWLPYKPTPPREIIYQRVIETPITSEFQPDRQPNYAIISSSKLSIPIDFQQENFLNYVENNQSSIFDQFAWSTQQQLDAIQYQSISNQYQQHINTFIHTPTQLTTPTLIVNYPPVTRIINSYVQKQDYQPTLMYHSYR